VAVVVFRSRLDAAHIDEFTPVASRMLELAQGMPGFMSYKAFNADDGERVSTLEFETSEDAAGWGR
jgi:heme-degrading monooxygenase HmoA